MPFVPVKCPSCGGDIQLDNSNEGGFCVYCGSKVLYKDAVQKMELSGSVKVQSNIEPMLKSAHGFLALGRWPQAEKLFENIIQQDSTDFRGWWGLFLAKTYSVQSQYYFDRHDKSDTDAYFAINIAPENKKSELQGILDSYLKQVEAAKNADLTEREKAEVARKAEELACQAENEAENERARTALKAAREREEADRQARYTRHDRARGGGCLLTLSCIPIFVITGFINPLIISTSGLFWFVLLGIGISGIIVMIKNPLK